MPPISYPIALISYFISSRVWFKSQVSLGKTESLLVGRCVVVMRLVLLAVNLR